MGNAATIYDEKCLVYSPDQLGSCPVYEEHLETMKFITQTGKVLEKTVYQNFNVDTLPDKLRISWFQLYGQCLKNGGLALPASDPYRENILAAGKAEKLIGQMENEYSTIINCLILKNIQELRLYHQYIVVTLYDIFQKYRMALRFDEEKATRFESSSDYLKNRRSEFKNIHSDLHDKVINVFEALNRLKDYLPAIIEAQMRANTYTNNYLEYILENFRDNKKIQNYIIPLASVGSELTYDVPDYRRALYGNDLQRNRKNVEINDKGLDSQRPYYGSPNDVDPNQGNQQRKNYKTPQNSGKSDVSNGGRQYRKNLNVNPNDAGPYNYQGNVKMNNPINPQDSINSEINDTSRQYQRTYKDTQDDVDPYNSQGNRKMKSSVNPQNSTISDLNGSRQKRIQDSVLDDIVRRIENRQAYGKEITGIPFNRRAKSNSEAVGLPNQRDSQSTGLPPQRRARSSNEATGLPDERNFQYNPESRQKPVKTGCGGSGACLKQNNSSRDSSKKGSSVKTSCTSSSAGRVHQHGHKHNNQGKSSSVRGDISKNQNSSKSDKKVEIDSHTKYLHSASDRNDQVATDNIKLDSLSTSSLKPEELNRRSPAHY